MLDWINTMIEEITDTAQIFIVLLCIFVIGVTAFRTRALVPVLGMVLLAALVIFFTSDAGLSWLPDMIEEETAISVPGVSGSRWAGDRLWVEVDGSAFG